ncbi:MAG: energy-coupling factor transporter transmembrane protein EcfT [Mollicutes bacterium PWAP]|nr:energy-coupling factor transporter transmembrane protein EcfT [Mollicutes bacterium PWAP]
MSSGGYINKKTILHKFNSIVKILALIVFICVSFIGDNIFIQLIILLPVAFFYILSKPSFKSFLSLLITILLIGIIVFVLQIYFTDSSTIKDPVNFYFKWWKFNFSDKAISLTLIVIIRITIVMFVSSILIRTTKSIDLTRGIETLLMPFKLIGIPSRILARIISLVFRFMPNLSEEAKRIMKSQASRGVSFKGGNIIKKSKATLTLIVPLFISAFNKAEDLSNAMTVRGYNPYKKTPKYRRLKLKWFDILAFLFFVSLIVFVILNRTEIIPNWIYLLNNW